MLPITVQDNLKGPNSGRGNPPDSEGGSSESSGLALTESLRNKILYEWNDTRADFPDACVHELFEQQVARDPTRLRSSGGGKTLTYGELNQRANQVANYLRKRSVGPDDTGWSLPAAFDGFGRGFARSLEVRRGLCASRFVLSRRSPVVHGQRCRGQGVAYGREMQASIRFDA